MRPDELKARLRGVLAFSVTPFKQDLSLDAEGLRKNIRSGVTQLLTEQPTPFRPRRILSTDG